MQTAHTHTTSGARFDTKGLSCVGKHGLTLWYEEEVQGHEGPHHYTTENFRIRTLYYIETEINVFDDAGEWDSLCEFADLPAWSELQEDVN